MQSPFLEAYRRLSVGDLAAYETARSAQEPLWQAALAGEYAIQTGSSAQGRARWLHMESPAETATLAFARFGESIMRSEVLSMSASWEPIRERLAEATADARSELVARLAHAWCFWRDPVDAAPDLEALLHQARELGLNSMTVEIEALRALFALERDDLTASVDLARRASRMARAEEIPHLEILTNVVLSRVRRLQDRGHLAIRILRGLRPHTPPAWRRWLNWELCMAGAPPTDTQGATAQLARLLRGVVDGDVDGTLREAGTDDSPLPKPFRRDRARVIELLLGPGHGRGDAGIKRWRDGETHRLPSGLSGLAFMSEDSDLAQPQCAYVLAGAKQAARIPAASLRLVARRDDVHLRPSLVKTKARADSGLALLAFARGQSIERSDYFKQLYGFEYEAGPHGAMFGMHRKRMRVRLELDAAGLRLVLSKATLLPDPRSGEELVDRALRAVSMKGEVSARDLARMLNVPLRSAQRTLAELIGEGALQAQGEGPSVRYRVEDTTFSEPTQSRLFSAVDAEA